MAGERKWIREYDLTFVWESGSLGVTSIGQKYPLDISFDISYDPQKMGQGVLDLRIKGLRESNIAKLTQLGVKLFFSVGYSGQGMVRIFTGDLRKLTVDSDQSKHETKMIFVSSRIGSKPFHRKFPSGVTHYERLVKFIEEIRKDVPEIATSSALRQLKELRDSEPNRAELEIKVLPFLTLLTDEVDGPLTTQDTALEELTQYLKTFRIDITTHNDTLYLVRSGGKFKFEGLVQAELGSNLLSPPRRRLDNMEAAAGSSNAKILLEMQMLLEPSIVPNSVVVASHARNDAGAVEEKVTIIKVTEVKHSGRYRGNSWYTTVAGTEESESYLITAPIKSVAKDIEEPYREPLYITPKEYNQLLDIFSTR